MRFGRALMDARDFQLCKGFDLKSISLTLTIVCYKPSNIETSLHAADGSWGGSDGPN